jgi:hypothetical protein
MRDETFDFQIDSGADTVVIPSATPCQCCGASVPKRPGHGALRYPHRCPHGRDCAAAEPAIGAYLAGRGTCPDCNAERLAERRGRAAQARTLS